MKSRLTNLILAAVLATGTGAAAATVDLGEGSAGQSAMTAAAPAGQTGPMAASSAATPSVAAPLSAASLEALYGTGAGEASNLAVSEQTLEASDTGNAVIAGGSITSGSLSFTSGAFGNFNGVGNFVFNTGNNNTLQGSINITILTPPK